MRQLQPVIWAKGTFLTPNHLQLQDLFLESLLEFRWDALNFRPWGLLSLQVDREALSGGYFTIESAAGIFPDGLVFDIPAADAAPAPKPLAQYLKGEQESIDLYLAIPPYRYGGLNVTAPMQNADTRYLAEMLVARDENTGLNERQVQVARKNLRLLVDAEARAGTPALHVARVRKTAAGLPELDPQFVPPLLDISANDFLMSILRRLLEILIAKSSTLAGMRRQKNQSLADFTAADIANFWLLYTVNAYLPQLRHIFETRRGHPENLFTVLTSLAGALTTFSLKLQPRDLPAYAHDQLGPCFADLDEKLRMLLETVVPSNFVSLALKLTQPSIYATAIADEKYLSSTKWFLAVSAEMPEAELITKAPQLIKTCSATHVDHLIRHALPGIPLRHVAVPPTSIPIKLNYQYFSLSQAGAAWEAIVRARNFAAFMPGDFPNPQVELIILLPQAE
ncbi:MAG TPA: type VI secretion system baseplate subunit TssK [Bryobacteraceae bacterium]|nr:type VI secretion system baseplate subunit TssK [Bryobacteraceae bacterium]